MRLLKMLGVGVVTLLLAMPATAQEKEPAKKKAESKPAEKKDAEKKEKPAEKKPAEKKPEAKKEEAKKEEAKKEEAKKEEAKPAEKKKEEAKPAEKKKDVEEKKPAEEKKAEEKPAKKEEEKAAEIEAKSEVVLSGLYNPCGIAIQPETGHIFVSDSGGLQVVRFDPNGDGTMEAVITDFPQDVYGKGPKYEIGPLGLAFLDKDTLVVGGGGQEDGKELLRVYKVPEPGKSIKAEEMAHSLGPIAPGEASKKGEGNFYGIAIGNDSIYVTCNGDDTKGWVSRSQLKEGEPGEFTTYIATKPKVNVDAPVGITLHPSRGLIVVGQAGEINKPLDSLLTFYDPADGSLMLSLECHLHDVVALAYSPREQPRLYALDFAWMDAPAGGLFRLDKTIEDGKQGCVPVPVLSLDKPTAMTFDEEGNLYVTVIGTAEEGSEEKPGKVLKISGDL